MEVDGEERLSPDRAIFESALRSHGVVPLTRRLGIDWLTPTSAYRLLGASVLLESVEGERDRDRFSFIGFDSVASVRLENGRFQATFFDREVIDQPIGEQDPLELFKAFQAEFFLPVFPSAVSNPSGGVGYLSYEIVQRFEKVSLREKPDPLNLPELLFVFPASFLVFDRLTQSQTLAIQGFRSHPETKGDPSREYERVKARIDEIAGRLVDSNPSRDSFSADSAVAQPRAARLEASLEQFTDSVERVRGEIIAGEILQAVVSQGVEVPWTGSAFDAYRRLRWINPSPYMFFLDFGEFELFGASPEVMIRVRDGRMLLKPIAGTRPRPKDPGQDDAVAADLLKDEKELAEHLMLVDLGRNDLGRVARTGTVLLTREMFVQKFSHVLHLVSEVQADLDDGLDCFDAIRATFPAGTVSGAPKIRAMEIVDQIEKTKRGPYAGLVGYFDGLGNFDSCITIRCAVRKGDRLSIRSGAGIVFDSEPEREFEETLSKARALLTALGCSLSPEAPEVEPCS